MSASGDQCLLWNHDWTKAISRKDSDRTAVGFRLRTEKVADEKAARLANIIPRVVEVEKAAHVPMILNSVANFRLQIVISPYAGMHRLQRIAGGGLQTRVERVVRL